ncbi:hypothetical protein RLV_6287 [Rhizobium leguminosarum bv. viciae]|nr:hypothetical protein RLV_6287 [Rhizobium leguminosarum bv. viciae]
MISCLTDATLSGSLVKIRDPFLEAGISFRVVGDQCHLGSDNEGESKTTKGVFVILGHRQSYPSSSVSGAAGHPIRPDPRLQERSQQNLYHGDPLRSPFAKQ